MKEVFSAYPFILLIKDRAEAGSYTFPFTHRVNVQNTMFNHFRSKLTQNWGRQSDLVQGVQKIMKGGHK